MGLNEFHFGFIVGIFAGTGLFVLGIVIGLSARLFEGTVAKLRGTRKPDLEDWTDKDYEEAYYGSDTDTVTEVPVEGPTDEFLEQLAALHRHSNTE